VGPGPTAGLAAAGAGSDTHCGLRGALAARKPIYSRCLAFICWAGVIGPRAAARGVSSRRQSARAGPLLAIRIWGGAGLTGLNAVSGGQPRPGNTISTCTGGAGTSRHELLGAVIFMALGLDRNRADLLEIRSAGRSPRFFSSTSKARTCPTPAPAP